MARAPRTAKAAGEPTEARKRTKDVKRDPEFDVALGTRIRAARIAAGMSQAILGSSVGISTQQMQKYETGKDRVAASTLQKIALALRVHPGSFFDEDAPHPVSSAMSEPRSTLAGLRSAQRIGERIERLGDPAIIRRLMALIEAIEDATGVAVGGDQTSENDAA